MVYTTLVRFPGESVSSGVTPQLQNPEYKTTIYQCLSHPHRRYTLHRLHETETPLALTALADTIADWAAESPQSDRSDQTTRDVQMTLHHIHLPKLADADLVRYDPDQKEVGLSDCPEELFDGDQRLPAP